MSDRENKKENSKNVFMVSFSHFETDPRVKREAYSLAKNGYRIFCVSLRNKNEKKIVKHRNNITVVKKMHWINSLPKGSFIRYILGSTLFVIIAFFELLKISAKNKIRFIHIHNPPDHLTVISLPFKLLKKSKVILDRHEPFAIHFISKFGLYTNSILYSLLLAYEKFSYKNIDAILTINDIEKFEVRKLVPSTHRVTTIKNSFDLASFSMYDLNKHQILNKNNKFIILYQGIVSEKRDIDTIIYAVEKLKGKIPDLQCYIVGEGDFLDKAIQLTNELSINHLFKFSEEWIKQNELLNIMNGSDVFLLTLKDIPVYHRAAPNKLFEYMFAKKPIIAAKLPTILSLTEKKCLYYEPGNPVDLSNKILMLYTNRNLSEEMIRSYNDIIQNNIWDLEETKLIALYQELDNES